jgi:hypothetical protein
MRVGIRTQKQVNGDRKLLHCVHTRGAVYALSFTGMFTRETAVIDEQNLIQTTSLTHDPIRKEYKTAVVIITIVGSGRHFSKHKYLC